jgi:hypothetical protein
MDPAAAMTSKLFFSPFRNSSPDKKDRHEIQQLQLRNTAWFGFFYAP